MKRVLVTGGNGFLGRSVLPLLAGSEFEAHAVTQSGGQCVEKGVAWHSCDLMDRAQTDALLSTVRPTHLLHLAWYTEPGKYWRSTQNYYWTAASLNLFASFRERGGIRAVTAGTCAEYDWSHGVCREDSTPRTPSTPYGFCKNALFELQESLSRETGLSSAWGRIFFVYGPGEHPAKLIPSAIRSLSAGQPFSCTSGEQERDFIHVLDAARAFVALLGNEMTGGVNVGSGSPVAVREVVKIVAEYFGRHDLVNFGGVPSPTGEPPLLAADVTRLTNEAGWKPEYDISSGIENAIRWWTKG